MKLFSVEYNVGPFYTKKEFCAYSEYDLLLILCETWPHCAPFTITEQSCLHEQELVLK